MSFSARSGVVAVLAVFVTSVAVATSAAAVPTGPEPISRTPLCRIGGASSSAKSSSAKTLGLRTKAAHASWTIDGVAEGLTKFALEKAVGVNVERYAVMGMSHVLSLISKGALTPDSPERRIFDQLRAINARLGEVESRVNRVGERVNQVIGEARQTNLNRDIKEICGIAGRQLTIYNLYRTSMDEAERLGWLLAGPNPALADQPDALGITPRQRTKEDFEEFVDQYRLNYLELQGQLHDLHRLLVPDPGASKHEDPPILTTFGLLRMSKQRFLTRQDSVDIRELYRELAQIRALASWMAAEYWDARKNPREETKVWDAFVNDNRKAELGQPLMIPHGVILDVGSGARDSTNGKSMWFAPTDRDLGWLPPNYSQPMLFQLDEVPNELDRLNERGGRGKGWHAPDNWEFRPLISTDCAADPERPTRALQGCANAVPGGANIAAYLQGINPDKTWQELFCQSSVKEKCPPGAGPTSPRQAPHAFIWTSDKHVQRLYCGWNSGYGPNRNRSNAIVRLIETYAGYQTLGPVQHQVFPHFPQRIPNPRNGSGDGDLQWIEEGCTDYLRPLVYGVPDKGIKRNHLFEGVLLATRFSGAWDVNQRSNWDYMAQPVPRG